jgi:UPF0755 protein
VSSGPPPVPGGRSQEEREAARREREARRTGRTDDFAAPAATAPRPEPDWRDEADHLATQPPSPVRPRRSGGDGGGRSPRWGRIVVAAIGLAVLAGVAWFANSLFQPFKSDSEGQEVRVQIPEGSSLGDIATILEDNGVIENSGFFQLRARLAGRTGDLKPGSFVLSEDMSFNAALDALEKGVPPNITVISLPEGLSRKESAPIVKSANIRGNYMRATRRNPNLNPRKYGAKGATSLEGFLFPATYELKKGRPARALVNEQLAAFKRNIAKVDMSYAKRKNLTVYDVLIIASLIDREAAVAKERALVSSVIYNRLGDGISLGIDATVRYIYGNWTEPLKQSELANPSPYNTRVNEGLPPGPIGNPGLAAIRAAARPARTDYLFYVAAVCGNGRHKFAETDAEFQGYVDEYNSAREERGGKSPTEC